MGTLGFGGTGILTITESSQISSDNLSVEATTADSFIFTETGINSGVFTTFNAIGNSDATVLTTCSVDDFVDFSYGGSTVRLVCATSNASASLDAGAEWMPGEPAAYSVTDPDMNRNGQLVEVLEISGNNIIPTVIIGEPKTLLAANINGGTPSNLGFASSEAFGDLTAIDATDGSKRILVTAAAGTSDATSVLTIRTGWDATTMTPLSGTTDGAQMLFYDICSLADNLVTTAIAVTMDMGSDHAAAGANVALAEPGPNSCSGEIHQTAAGAGIDGDAATELTFTLTHLATTGTAGDYMIAADLHSYSVGNQANGIYRMEAVETGVQIQEHLKEQSHMY